MTLLEEAPHGVSTEHRETSAEERELDRVEQLLVEEFGASLGGPTVSAVFRSAAAAFDGATVRLYVPMLCERAARQRINALLAPIQRD